MAMNVRELIKILSQYEPTAHVHAVSRRGGLGDPQVWDIEENNIAELAEQCEFNEESVLIVDGLRVKPLTGLKPDNNVARAGLRAVAMIEREYAIASRDPISIACSEDLSGPYVERVRVVVEAAGGMDALHAALESSSMKELQELIEEVETALPNPWEPEPTDGAGDCCPTCWFVDCQCAVPSEMDGDPDYERYHLESRILGSLIDRLTRTP